MSAKVFSSRSKTCLEFVGDSMNCMIERTERASLVLVMYIVFFFLRSHQAGAFSHNSSL